MKVGYLWIFAAVSSLNATPSGMQVVSGQADSKTGSDAFVVSATDRAILQWDSFSIGASESVEFLLPDSGSAVLNRVSGSQMSELMGSLQSNGQVYLINPNGILIGQEAGVDAGHFIASTFDVLDEAFLAGENLLFKGDSTASIINLGTISTPGGDAILLARRVNNEGIIDASNGTAVLAAGTELLLAPAGNKRVYIQAAAAKEASSVENSGQIKALLVEMQSAANPYAAAIRQTGRVDALGLKKEHGRVLMVAVGSVDLAGEIRATAAEELPEAPCPECFGEILVEGKEICVKEQAMLDVSNSEGGDVISLGFEAGEGGRRAEALVTSEGTLLRADAMEKGNGGKVLLWGTGQNYFGGYVSAQGGQQGGDGGFIDVSTTGTLIPGGFVDTSAPSGLYGTLLYDPESIRIVSPAEKKDSADASLIDVVSLASQLGRTNVTLATDGACGDIVFSKEADLVWAVPTTLTLNASRDIAIYGNVGSPGVRLDFAAQGDLSVDGELLGKAIALFAKNQFDAKGSIESGGALSIDCGGDLRLTDGVVSNSSSFKSAPLTISVKGNLIQTGSEILGSGAVTLEVGGDHIASTSRIKSFLSGKTAVGLNAAIGGNLVISKTAFSTEKGSQIRVAAGGDIVLNGAEGRTRIGSKNSNGNISMQAGGSILLNGWEAKIGHGGVDPGSLALTAGKNIILKNGSRIVNMGEGANSSITLTVDHASGTNFGSGSFQLSGGSSIATSNPKTPVKIHSGSRLFNHVEGEINGSVFVPGALGVSSPSEEWGTGPYPSGQPFRFYYKGIGGTLISSDADRSGRETNYNAKAIALRLASESVQIAAEGPVVIREKMEWNAPTCLSLKASGDLQVERSLASTNGELHLLAGRDLIFGSSRIEAPTLSLKSESGARFSSTSCKGNLVDIAVHDALHMHSGSIGPAATVEVSARALSLHSGLISGDSVKVTASAGDLSLSSSSIRGSNECAVNIPNGNLVLQGSNIASLDGPMTISAAGSMTLSGAASITGSAPLSVDILGNALLTGSSRIDGELGNLTILIGKDLAMSGIAWIGSAGKMEIAAGSNLRMQGSAEIGHSRSGPIDISAGGSVALEQAARLQSISPIIVKAKTAIELLDKAEIVADKATLVAEGSIGHISTNGRIFAKEGVRLYSSARIFNDLPSEINREAYIPQPLGVSGMNEQWGCGFETDAANSYTAPFTLYYKNIGGVKISSESTTGALFYGTDCRIVEPEANLSVADLQKSLDVGNVSVDAESILFKSPFVWQNGSRLSLSANADIAIESSIDNTSESNYALGLIVSAGRDVFVEAPLSVVQAPLNVSAGQDLFIQETIRSSGKDEEANGIALKAERNLRITSSEVLAEEASTTLAAKEIIIQGGYSARAGVFSSGAGEVSIAAAGDLTLFGGDGSKSDAEIYSKKSPLSISAEGNIRLQAGTSRSSANALIGNGGKGKIEVASKGKIELAAAPSISGDNGAAQIYSRTSESTDIEVTAGGDIEISSGGSAQCGAAGIFCRSQGKIQVSCEGNLTVNASDLPLAAYLQNRGAAPAGIGSLEKGLLGIVEATVKQVGGDIVLNSNRNNYALIGCGDTTVAGSTTGFIKLEEIKGSIHLNAFAKPNLNGGSGFVQIGHLNGSVASASSLHGDITISADGDVVLSGGVEPNAYARIGHGGQKKPGGSDDIRAGVDITTKQMIRLIAPTPHTAVIAAYGNKAISAKAGDSMELQGKPLIESDQGAIELFAGVSHRYSGTPLVKNRSFEGISIVADNLYPEHPAIGTGGLSLGAAALQTKGPIRLYSSMRVNDAIDSATFNGKIYEAGRLGLNSERERWGFSYPQTIEGLPYTVFYKAISYQAIYAAQVAELLSSNSVMPASGAGRLRLAAPKKKNKGNDL